MARKVRVIPLSSEQQDEADRIYSALLNASQEDIRAIANQIASTTDATIFGENEFILRDIVHRVAAKGMEIALQERKKRGTKGPVEDATDAMNPPVSSDISPKHT